MKIAPLAALIAALALPIGVSAQVVQQPPVQTQRQYNQAAVQYKHWTKRLAGINLSTQQQQQVQHLLDQFAAQHPAGSPRDKSGIHVLRDQIFAVLNPQQQAQLHQQMEALKAQQMQRRMQEQGQGQPQQQPPVQPQQVQPAPPLR
jgi:hypothetical protein